MTIANTIPQWATVAYPRVAAEGRVRGRILISANATSPVRGSEPGIGWQFVSRLARFHDVTVLCSPGVPGKDPQDFRQEAADYLTSNGPIPGLHLEFVDPPPLSYWFQRESTLARRTLYYAGYAAWQRKALKVARELHRQQPFDLVHHLTITGYREPGYLWKLDAPFVWGPIGGTPSFPEGFFDLLSKKDRLFYRVRNMANRWQKGSSRCRAAAAKASQIWAISAEDADMVQHRWNKPVDRLPETGANVRTDIQPKNYDGIRPLRLVWSGLHLGRKALPILLHAIARLQNKNVELTVLGDGPATGEWKTTAEKLGLQNVTWTGQVSQAKAMETVQQADLMPFTSVLEGTPFVVVEALSLGLPVICHNACGMGTAVTDSSGIRIDMRDSATSIQSFADAIDSLLANPSRLRELSQGALKRSVELSWDNNVAQMLKVYDRIIHPGRVDKN